MTLTNANIVSPSQEGQKHPQLSPRPFRAIYFLLAMVLFAASTFKALELRNIQWSTLSYRQLFSLSIASLELLLSVWLISGKYTALVRLVAIGSFAVFAGVAFYHTRQGAGSCGCFGSIAVHPWLTTIFDLAAVGSLVLVGPKRSVVADKLRWGFFAVLCILVGAMIVDAGITYRQHKVATITSEIIIPKDHSLVVIEPHLWQGKKFPLAQYTTLKSQIMFGRWTVILYHSDCDDCRQALPRYERLADRLKAKGVDQSIALIEMPPYTEGAEQLVSKYSSALVGRLDTSHEWFATTPVVLELTDGRVDAAYEGDAAVEASKSIAP